MTKSITVMAFVLGQVFGPALSQERFSFYLNGTYCGALTGYDTDVVNGEVAVYPYGGICTHAPITTDRAVTVNGPTEVSLLYGAIVRTWQYPVGVEVITGPSKGNLSAISYSSPSDDYVATYTPPSGSGTDTIVFRAFDKYGLGWPGTMTIHYSP